jgi:phosphatidyl-myo-inositol dimannoside synthase
MSASRVLLAVNDFPPLVGGESSLYHALARHLPSREAIVLAPHGRGEADIDSRLPIEIVRRWLPLHRGGLSRALRGVVSGCHLLGVLRARPVRYLFCGQLLSLGIPTRLLAALFRIRYSVFVHGADLADYHDRWPWGPLARWVLAGSDAVIVNSRFTADLVERLAPGAAPRIAVLPIGVDNPPPVDPGTIAALRRKYALDDAPVLLSVARLVPMKGHDVAIQSLPKIRERVPSLRYLIVGDGPHREALQSLARRLGVLDTVVFAGRVPARELPAHYALATLFVQLSRATGRYDGLEGFGLTFLEAASHGLPSIAGRSGGAPEAVEDGQSGILVPPEDIASFVAVATRLLRDPRERARMSDAARRWAAAHRWQDATALLLSLAGGS